MNTEEFFIPDNEVRLAHELDYERAQAYVRCAQAFARSSYQSVYVIDYFRKGFLYVSPNPMFLCGLTPEEVMRLGYQFYLDYVPKDELEMLLEINRAGFAFHHDVPHENREGWYICYDFHVLNNGHPILINHKLTSLAMTSDGRVWLGLCVVSASTHTTAGHIQMHSDSSAEYFEYNLNTRRWDRKKMPSLTAGEKAMLVLSMQGFTIIETADKMCLSVDTIKKYRRQIFDKLEVKNMPEAIVAAANSKLI